MKKIVLSLFVICTTFLNAQLDSSAISIYPAQTPAQAQYITVPMTSSLQFTSEFTLECWVFVPNSSSQEIHLIETYFGNSGGYVLRLTQSNAIKAFAMGDGQPLTTGSSMVSLNEWNHVAATYSTLTGELKVYLNGVLDGTTTPNSSIYSNTSTLKIGARGDDSDVNNPIFMDEVRIWNVARSEAEIAGSMSSCLVGNEAGLVLYYDFEDELVSGVVTDRSSSANHGAIVTNVEPYYWGVFDCAEFNSINENTTIEVSVAPNPASSFLTINADATIESIRIFDLNGTLVQTEKSNTFSVEALAEGMYILTITTDKGSISKRFVKK